MRLTLAHHVPWPLNLNLTLDLAWHIGVDVQDISCLLLALVCTRTIQQNHRFSRRCVLGTGELHSIEGDILTTRKYAGYTLCHRLRLHSHVDTAQAYKSEAHVGQGLREAGVNRNEVFISKFGFLCNVKTLLMLQEMTSNKNNIQVSWIWEYAEENWWVTRPVRIWSVGLFEVIFLWNRGHFCKLQTISIFSWSMIRSPELNVGWQHTRPCRRENKEERSTRLVYLTSSVLSLSSGERTPQVLKYGADGFCLL